MRRWILLLLLAQGVGRPAAAASLSVAPGAPCLDAAELTERIERELGTTLDAAVPLRFELSSNERGEGYGARLDVFDDRGARSRRRVVESADCATLQETVAVAVTLALSGDTSAAPPVPALSTPVDASRSSAAQRAAMQDSASPEPSAEMATTGGNEAWVPSLSAGLLVDAGTLPAVSLGADIGATLATRWVQIQAIGTLLFEREVGVSGQRSADAAARLGFVAGSLLVCTPLSRESMLSSRACLGWELGQLTGEGRRVDRPRRGRLLWSAPRLDIGGRVALAGTPWGLGVLLSAEAPLNRDDFTLGPDAVVHRPPVVVGRAAVGIDLAFE